MGKKKPKIPSVSYKKVGTGKVARWSCDRYVGSIKGKKISEICTVKLDKLGLSLNDFRSLKNLSEAFSEFDETNAQVEWRQFQSLGFPVETTTFDDGKKGIRMVVTQIRRKKIPTSYFQAPKDYKSMDALTPPEALTGPVQPSK